jgi:hypothetical protein
MKRVRSSLLVLTVLSALLLSAAVAYADHGGIVESPMATSSPLPR